MVKLSVKLLGVLSSIYLVESAHINSCTAPNTVALTFDDGPTVFTNALIDTLNKYNIKATFFVNAHNYQPYAEQSRDAQNVIKKAYNSGHQIASHTYYHKIEPNVNDFKNNLIKMDNFIKSVIGVTPRYFRAPGGDCNDNCVRTIEGMGYRSIKWDTDTKDWKTNSATSIATLNGAFKKNNKNYLVKMHDSMEHTVKETVPWIINSGMLQRYRFVTVAECLGE
ncbi:carbohydrate esterase family 4 protein, partial [Piromyces sp. E2]